MSTLPPVLLIGCGRMGTALVHGWQKLAPGADIRTVNPGPVEVDIPRYADPADIPADFTPALIIIAVKPQKVAEVLPAYRAYAGQGVPFLSIAAGITLARLEALLGPTALVRAMPNTPASIGQGISVCVANDKVSASQRELATQALRAAGPVEWVEDEGLMDAVTALSGSGPAYVFYLTETLTAAGVLLGLAPELAARLARQTVIGSAGLLAQTDETAAKLRENVTSPNGTTAAALAVLRGSAGLQDLITGALKAAHHRSRELAS